MEKLGWGGRAGGEWEMQPELARPELALERAAYQQTCIVYIENSSQP